MLTTSFGSYWETLGTGRTWTLLFNSIALAAATTAVAGTLGVPLAIVVSKTDLPLRGFIATLLSLPLIFPPYVLAVGWFQVLGRQGFLAQSLGPAFGEMTSRLLFGFPGAVLVLGTAFLPVVLLLTSAYLRGVSPALEDAARLSFGWPAVLRRITVPLAFPGIALALILVFLLSMGEFGAPLFLRINVFPVASYTQISAFNNPGAATAAAMPLVLVVAAGLFLEDRLLHGQAWQFRWSGVQSARQIHLGSNGYGICGLALFLGTVLVAVPVVAVAWRGLSAAALGEALNPASASALRSILYACAAASLVTLLGFFLGYTVQRRALIIWRPLDILCLFLFTLPGTVLGIGTILTWNRASTNWIYASPAMLVIGLSAQYIVIGSRGIAAGFAQLPESVEEAAEVAGAGWFRRTSMILVPLLKPSLIASWGITFIFSLRDTSLALLLAPPGRDTLTSRTMTLMANGSPDLIAALCLLSIAVALIPLALFCLARIYLRRSWRRSA